MEQQIIEQYLIEKFPGVVRVDNWGYRFFLYAADDKLPFITIATADSEYDSASNLNRDGIYRINIGVSKQTFDELIKRQTQWDYTALNVIFPHPVYAAQHYVCVINPEGPILKQTFQLIDEAYLIAKKRFEKRQPTK